MFGLAGSLAWLGFDGTPEMAAKGFDGTIVSTTCIKGVLTVAPFFAASTCFVASVLNRTLSASRVAGSTRVPGLMVFASVKPITTDIADKIRQ
jgi:hypothetical protein